MTSGGRDEPLEDGSGMTADYVSLALDDDAPPPTASTGPDD